MFLRRLSAALFSLVLASVAISQAPVITTQPVSRSANVGETVLFTVGAEGPGPLSYQWFVDGFIIFAATQPTLTLVGVQPQSAGQYTVRVSNAGGMVTSQPATLTVVLPLSAPAITSGSPPNGTAGQPYSFTVRATGNPAPSFTFGLLPPGLTLGAGGTLSGTPAQAGNFTFSISAVNSQGTDTRQYTIRIDPAPAAPVITQQPASLSVIPGQSASFSVGASGVPAVFTYQWRFGGTPIPGATGPSFALASVQAQDAGLYDVVVSNSVGSVTSSPATLTVGDPGEPPVITSGTPAAGVVGQAYLHVVTASGRPAPSFSFRGELPPGLVFGVNGRLVGTPTRAGDYEATFVADNAAGNESTQTVTVRIGFPAGQTIDGVPPAGTQGATYSHRFNATALPAPYVPQFSISSGGLPGGLQLASDGTLFGVPATAGSFTFTVGLRAVPAVGSEPLALQTFSLSIQPAVSSAPVITQQPASQTLADGQTAVLAVVAVGTPTPTFTWSRDGAVVPGATQSVLILPNASAASAGSYRVQVSNSAGSVLSQPATVSVQSASKLVNVSTRGRVEGGGSLIGGFVVADSGRGTTRQFLIRAAGPALAAFGVGDAAPNPRLRLFVPGQTEPVAENDDWSANALEAARIAAATARAGAFPFASGSRDAALLVTVNAGAYTAEVLPSAGTAPGTALVEAYEIDPAIP